MTWRHHVNPATALNPGEFNANGRHIAQLQCEEAVDMLALLLMPALSMFACIRLEGIVPFKDADDGIAPARCEQDGSENAQKGAEQAFGGLLGFGAGLL